MVGNPKNRTALKENEMTLQDALKWADENTRPEAVELLLDQRGETMSEERRNDCIEYLKKLNDYDYKFGVPIGFGAPGADFFRS